MFILGLEDYSSYSFSNKKPRTEQQLCDPRNEIVRGRDASYGTIKRDPNDESVAIADDDCKDDDDIKVDRILTNKKFNFWNLPAKAKVLLVSNIPVNVANPRFVSLI